MKIIENIARTVYQQFGAALLFSIFFMAAYLYIRKIGWLGVAEQWIETFRRDGQFRKMFCFVFYTMMILLRTLLSRRIWPNPLEKVIGELRIYADGVWYTESVENMLMFVPFTILLLWTYGDKLFKYKKNRLSGMLGMSFSSAFLFSLFIEIYQLVFHMGTFQLADLLHNTLGGTFGGVLYYFGQKIKLL